MSFILDIVKFGLGQFGIEAKGNSPKAIASSAITSFLTQKVNSSIKKSNPQPQTGGAVSANTAAAPNAGSPQQETVERIEREVKIEIKADTLAHIPVVYGEAWVQPLLVDARITNNNCTMWYCVALSEVTGVDVDGNPSNITFEEIYWNNKKLTFLYDGVTVAAAWEGKGGKSFSATADTTLSNNVKIYCYNNGSASPTNIRTQGLAVTHGDARSLMPSWTTNHAMSSLVFALIRVDYDADKEVTGIGNLRFKIRNSLKRPGDVLNDYMTNTVYGAGIPITEID
jgi:hypothetical protein